MKKIVFIALPILAVSLVTTAVCVGVYQSGFNTITLTFNATNKGYFDVGGGTTQTIINTEVRRGVYWSNLVMGHEIPNNPTCNNDEYQFSFWKFKGDEVPSDFRITEPMTLDAVYASNVRDFCYDPWEIVIREANLGLENLKEYYHRSSFIGLTRDLDFGGSTYKVRVVGEAIDPLVNTTNRFATLTFQFDQVIPGYAYDTNGHSTYSSSSIRNILNGRIKSSFDSLVAENCQQVVKFTNKGYGDGGEENLETTQDYVFLPSLRELNVLNVDNEDTEKEGSIYPHYSGTVNPLEGRQKYYYNDFGEKINATYWTRSPIIGTFSNTDVMPIDSSGNVGMCTSPDIYESADVTLPLGITPCFCIGRTYQTEYVPFADDSWEHIVEVANEGLGALSSIYKKDYEGNDDTFVGLTHPLQIGDVTYNVRVIGENQDFDYIGTTSVKRYRPLTFQFTSVYGEQEDRYVPYRSGSGDVLENNFWYSDTYMATCLDGYGNTDIPETWGSDLTLLEQMPEALKNGIPVVRKATFDYQYTLFGEHYDISELGLKVFPLSFDEYGENQMLGSGYSYMQPQSSIKSMVTPASSITTRDHVYQYYDYHCVKGDYTTEQKQQIVRERRVFNDKVDTYVNKTYKSTYSYYDPQLATKWSQSYLRGPNSTRVSVVSVLDCDNPYVMLHPTGPDATGQESLKWDGMPLTETATIKKIDDDYKASKNIRIGIVPAFCLGVTGD